MKTLYAVVESEYLNCDSSYEFQVSDDADNEEILEAAKETIECNLLWHVEDEDGNEIECY